MKAIPLMLTLFCLTAYAGEVPVDAPRFDNGKYSIVSSISSGAVITVIFKRDTPFFTSYIKQQFDCSSPRYRYIGMGSKSDEIIEDGTDIPWFSIQGEWNERIRNRVCQAPSETTASN